MILLPPNEYQKANQALNNIPFNTCFAHSVSEQYVTGKIFVDEINNPTVFYFHHPYGMSLLTGDYTNTAFIADFIQYCLNADRNIVDWMQVYPQEWCNVIEKIEASTGKIETYERVNFRFNTEKYRIFRKTIDLNQYEIKETTAEIFENMPGTVVPRFFWNNAEDFLLKSKGYTLIINNQSVSTAFAAYKMGNILEIGIQTVDGLYGKGYSAITCCRLIDYCIENNLEPVWACKKDNIGSLKLADKLGFEVSRTGPYYKINL